MGKRFLAFLRTLPAAAQSLRININLEGCPGLSPSCRSVVLPSASPRSSPMPHRMTTMSRIWTSCLKMISRTVETNRQRDRPMRRTIPLHMHSSLLHH